MEKSPGVGGRGLLLSLTFGLLSLCSPGKPCCVVWETRALWPQSLSSGSGAHPLWAQAHRVTFFEPQCAICQDRVIKMPSPHGCGEWSGVLLLRVL